MLIHKEAPGATEKISYGVPTFYLNGNLVHFGAQKNHIGLYPTSSGVNNFEKELKNYAHSTGAIRFPFDRPIPYALIRKIVKFRVKETTAYLKSKK